VKPTQAEQLTAFKYFFVLQNFLTTVHDTNDLAPALRPLTRKEQLEIVWKLSPPERLLELQLTQEKLDHWVDIAGSLIECGKDYNPSSSVCK
jgi:hypothetical protein